MIAGAEVSASVRASAREMLKRRRVITVLTHCREYTGERRKRKSPAGRKRKSADMARKYFIETYGCQMNVHDSERMAGLLDQAGYEPTTDDGDADVVLINTCSVREKAEEKLFTRLGEFHQMQLETGQRPLVAVAGCVAQQEGAQILRRSSAVDVIVGTQNLKRLPMLRRAGARHAGAAGAGRSISIRSATCRSRWASPGARIRSRPT